MKILVVGAHHDDIELGCAGTLAKLRLEGHKVYGIVLTNSETHYEIKNVHRPTERALKEGAKAAAIVGYTLLKTPDEFAANVGELEYTPAYMRYLESLIHKYNIDTIFTHWQYDMNTDHPAAAKISIIAARHLNRILMYRSNWYQPDRSFNGTFFSDISKTIAIKKRALAAYPGEIKRFGQAWIDSFIDANRTWGYTIGAKYAEVFEPIRYTL